jgi:hypothetical protein
VLAGLAEETDYDNFKSEVANYQREAGEAYEHSLHDVWTVMQGMQEGVRTKAISSTFQKYREKTAHEDNRSSPFGIDLNKLTRISPFLYHVTHQSSLNRIRRLRRLQSAAALMEAGATNTWLRTRRDSPLEFSIDGDPIVLTDQIPINERNIAFQDGWTLPDLIEAINQRVFFWRGGTAGLLKSNQGHFRKYNGIGHELAFLRLSFGDTNRLNVERGPELCKYNSGAARQNDGKPIPRGPNTFVQPPCADFSIGDVEEVVFTRFVDLPTTTEVCFGSWQGPWKPVFDDGSSDIP